jgi:hypothetical protein
MARTQQAIFLTFVLIGVALCDLYMHNPRGSNDRLDEANANRDNANRLFDSQNNAKGGYCIGPQMEFYEGSQLSVEWTNQHGCGTNPKQICNVVLQYMCGKTDDEPVVRIRDGTTTDTIPDTEEGAEDTTNGELTYGMHEPLQYYLDCTVRDRNMGLYIADRATVGGLTGAGRMSAIYTRQNNNGNRNGLECPEERDYYPYWHPTPWKDIAIMASKTSFCGFYRSNSQNVMSKGYCEDPSNPGPQTEQNNQQDCNSAGFDWKMQPSWGIHSPDCVQVPWSRENHLGNGIDGFANTYNMTIPTGEDCVKTDNCVCVLRLRYNISTVEDGWPTMSNPDTGFIDYNSNGVTNSSITQDPVVTNSMGNNTDANGNPINSDLKFAVDTSQFGRTFQDRSHTFKIIKRPNGVRSDIRIFNLNVRGKRGNIVQTYPGTEYDYVPQYLYVRVGDYIHFQWTGCDNNPAGNAGEGQDGTDRSNLVQIINAASSMPATDKWLKANPKKALFKDPALRLRFATLDQTGCQTRSQIGNNADNDDTFCAKLNAASPYFNGGLIKMNQTGTFHYMNTRNHNFSNRDQKGILYVVPLLPAWAVGVVVTGAVLTFLSIGVAGAMFYAKQNPHSAVANLFSKM